MSLYQSWQWKSNCTNHGSECPTVPITAMSPYNTKTTSTVVVSHPRSPLCMTPEDKATGRHYPGLSHCSNVSMLLYNTPPKKVDRWITVNNVNHLTLITVAYDSSHEDNAVKTALLPMSQKLWTDLHFSQSSCEEQKLCQLPHLIEGFYCLFAS